MATKYWVGGNGNWSSLTNWRTTSGGVVITTAPGSADAAVLDANSGTSVVTVDSNITIQTLTCTGFTGTLAFGTNTISLNSTGTIFTGATTMTVTGTPLIICTNSSATSRTITPTAVTEANSISFRITAGTGSLSFGTTPVFRDLDFTDGVNPTGYAGALGTVPPTIYGNFKASTGMTQTATANSITFAATSGTKTINTAGVTFDRPFTFDGVGGTFQLASALTSGASRTCTLTNGTLDLNGYTLTTGTFSSSNSNTRTLAFGSTGKLVLSLATGGSIFAGTTSTGATVTGTAPLVQLTYSGGTGTRNVIMWALPESQSISVEVLNNATDTVAIQGASGGYKNIDTTNFNGTLTIANSPRIFGNFTIGASVAAVTSTASNPLTFASTSGTKTITTNGKTIDAVTTFDGVGGTWTMQDNLTLSSTRTLTLTNGTLDLNNKTLTTGIFVGSGSVARSLLTYSVPIVITGNSATVVSFGTTGNLTVDVAPTFNLTSNPVATTGSRVISWGTPSNIASYPNINVTNGSDTVTTSGTTNLRNLTFTSGFTGTFGNLVRNIYGNLTLTSGMSVGSGTGINTFNNPTSQTITCADLTLDFPISYGISGGTLTFSGNLSIGSTQTLTYTAGKLVFTAGTTNSIGNFVASGTAYKYLATSSVNTQASIYAAGTVDLTKITIQDIAATGAWVASGDTGCVNGGNNTGIDFSTSVKNTNFLMFLN